MVSDFKSFQDYLTKIREQISERRLDLNSQQATMLIDANMPNEFLPTTGDKPRAGVLLIHGLLDSPFSLREIGHLLCQHGFVVRSVLLPGHGTRPDDLLHVHYEDWIHTVREAITSLEQAVDQIHLLGYSTGAILSLQEVSRHKKINGLILISPAIKIKAPIEKLSRWHALTHWLIQNEHWVTREPEIDYVKYKSITFNAVMQVSELSHNLRKYYQKKTVTLPVCMILSREDETISSRHALQFFSKCTHPHSRAILYSANNKPPSDKRISLRCGKYPERHIRHLSHSCLPFSENNPHYGVHGDFPLTSSPDRHNVIYGAYNAAARKILDHFHRGGMLRKRRLCLSYNPDFTNMCDDILRFLSDIRDF